MLRDHSVKVYVLKTLQRGNKMSFVEIRDHLKLTDGNLYPSLQGLLTDEYIEKVPTVDNVTYYRITKDGLIAFHKYVTDLTD